jgi:hypothetical protein
MSDITGSTQLYDQTGNREALAHIDQMLTRMRAIVEAAGGVCVKSQGDDVLSYFDTCEAGFRASWDMLEESWPAGLSVHQGMYQGEIIPHENDIYGDAVNTAARLSSLAKPGETLLGDNCYDALPDAARARLVMVGKLALKGKSTPTTVYGCSIAELFQQTVIFAQPEAERPGRTESVDVTYQGQTWTIAAGESLSIGRSSDCDVVLGQAWVSRSHAVMSLRDWQLEISDHSSAGTVVVKDGGEQINLHRRGTLISGTGVIYCGMGAEHSADTALHFNTQTVSILADPAGV